WSINPAVPYDNRFLPPNPYVTYATYRDPISGLAFEPRTRLDKWAVSGRTDWQLTEGLQATAIASYTDLSSTLVTDTDGSPLNVQMTGGVQTIDFYTLEGRLSGRLGRTDWTAGVFILPRPFHQRPDRQHPVPDRPDGRG